ncbi:MAG TPA: PrsW family glutamic-type intramembrane protease [Candidatus Dormibacteraeota bacterium]|nr:PrsW family glutamic-type intramembrane protease [Candidatus Dormibacteraeota bacterium]
MRRPGDDRRHSTGRRAGESEEQFGGPPLVTCPHCGSIVPSGEFCGHCGAHLTSGSKSRTHSFAAVPSQRVAQLSIISTLLPHLAHRRGRPFRIALIAGGAVVLVLAVLHLFAPATIAAVLVVPILYLIYLYEVEVYEDEPWLVVGATMATGLVLGFAFTNYAGGLLSRLDVTGDTETAFVLSGVTIPIVSQALMLAGPLFLYLSRPRFQEPLDGLAFGAASALGFTVAASLTAFWPLIAGPLLASGQPLDWAVRLTRAGLLVSVINASTTGLVAVALWLHRYDRRRANLEWQSGLLAATAVAFGVQIGLGMLTSAIQDLTIEFAVVAIAAVALLLYVRLVIHQALLVEGAEHEIGPESACPECHRMVPTMAFCPACGAARAAGSKQSRGRVGGTA